MYVCMYVPTTQYEQNVTRPIFKQSLNSEFSSPTPVAIPTLKSLVWPTIYL